jgi:hypothetical protein
MRADAPQRLGRRLDGFLTQADTARLRKAGREKARRDFPTFRPLVGESHLADSVI